MDLGPWILKAFDIWFRWTIPADYKQNYALKIIKVNLSKQRGYA